MKLSHVLVTSRAVYFDGITEVPCYIAEDGVEFHPGGRSDVNRLRVEFLTGTVHFDDLSAAPTPIYDELVSEFGTP